MSSLLMTAVSMVLGTMKRKQDKSSLRGVICPLSDELAQVPWECQGLSSNPIPTTWDGKLANHTMSHLQFFHL